MDNPEISLLNNIISSSADAIFALDTQGRFCFLNPAAEAAFGLPVAMLIGKGLLEVISPDDHGRVQEAMRCLSNKAGATDSPGIKILAKSGAKRWLMMSISPLSGDEEANGFVCVCKDITKEKKLEHEREEFIAMVTHDLKTPLSSIIGYSSMLLEKGLPDADTAGRASAEGIKVNADRMLSLASNFLSAGRMDERMFRVDPQPARIEPVVINSIEAMDHQLKEKGVSVEADFSPDLPEMKVDAGSMERVLCNLISNAIKFTPPGGRVAVRSYISSDGYVHIEVSDTGVGIPQDELPLLFDKYYQGANKTTGSGLGLFIAKSIVEAHKGEIRVASESGRGTVFTVRLPHS